MQIAFNVQNASVVILDEKGNTAFSYTVKELDLQIDAKQIVNIANAIFDQINATMEKACNQ